MAGDSGTIWPFVCAAFKGFGAFADNENNHDFFEQTEKFHFMLQIILIQVNLEIIGAFSSRIRSIILITNILHSIY